MKVNKHTLQDNIGRLKSIDAIKQRLHLNTLMSPINLLYTNITKTNTSRFNSRGYKIRIDTLECIRKCFELQSRFYSQNGIFLHDY